MTFLIENCPRSSWVDSFQLIWKYAVSGSLRFIAPERLRRGFDCLFISDSKKPAERLPISSYDYTSLPAILTCTNWSSQLIWSRECCCLAFLFLFSPHVSLHLSFQAPCSLARQWHLHMHKHTRLQLTKTIMYGQGGRDATNPTARCVQYAPRAQGIALLLNYLIISCSNNQNVK